ncbi:MAG: GNAT family N-acetyltransferase [Planctomycetota bacterium]
MSQPSPAIRRYTDRDRAEVLRLNRAALDAVGAAELPPEIRACLDADLAAIEATYLSGGGEFLVACEPSNPDRLIGMGALRRLSPVTGEIKRMRVDAEFQRRGVGAALLRRLEAVARQLGYTELILDAANELIAAQAFYRAHGYTPTGYREVGGLACIDFRKPL